MNLFSENCQRILLVAAGCVLGASATSADAEEGVLESYEASLDLPDAIAFRQFLELQRPSPEDPSSLNLPIVAKALDIAPDESGAFDHVYPFAELFAQADLAVRQEVAVDSHALLCNVDSAAMTEDEIGDTMNDTVLISDDVADRQYLAIKESLPGNEKAAFEAYLEEIKLGTSYMRFDHKALKSDIRSELAQWCAELETEILTIGARQ